MKEGFFEQLVEKYPRFNQVLQRFRASRVPYVAQGSAAECGLACLSMTLGLYGHHVTLEELRTRMPPSPGTGVSAEQLLNTAAVFGLRGRAVSVDLADLQILPAGSILHWEFWHYVVLEKADENGLSISDPAVGRLQLTWEQASRTFTGVAILLEPSDDFRRRAAPESALARLLKSILRDEAWSRVLLMAFTLQVLAFATPALTGLIVERIVPQGDDRLFSVVSIAAAAVALMFALATVVRSRLGALVMLRVGLQLRVDFTERLLGAPMRFIYDRQAGDIVFMNSGIDAVMQTITATALTGVVDGCMALLFMAVLWAAQPSLALAALGIAGLHMLAASWSASRQRTLAALELFSGRRLASESAESVYGFETIKSLGLESKRVTGTMNALVDMARVRSDADVVGSVGEAAQGVLRFMAPIALLLVGTSFVRAGTLSIGQMLSLTSLGSAALYPLASLSVTFSSLPRLRAYLERIDDVLQAPAEQRADERRHCPPLTGAVSLSSLSFRYSPITPVVLRDVSLEVKAGEFVAIVGRSGSGKSTLANVMLGLLEPTGGRVEYDGEDLQRLELSSLRAQLGYVPQRPYLFSQSIRDNLTVGDATVTFDAILEASKLAQIHDEISALPLGYDTIISNFAVFSGGQRQRLALARALLRRPKILLLDEATSAIDTVTERRIDEVVRTLGCTRIVIAHRLSTIERADRIVVVEGGVIEAIGNLETVLRESKTFRELYRDGSGTTG